jgi:hypothetical protein
MYQESSTRSDDIKDPDKAIKMRNLEQISKIITDGQQKKLFRQVDIAMTVGTIMGTISSYTQSKYYSLYHSCPNEDVNDEQYRLRLSPGLKPTSSNC